MSAVEAMAVAGAAALALGGLTTALPGGLRAGLVAQAIGVSLLGATGAALVAGHDAVGAGFASDVAPALGLDALSGFFLVVLAVTALPALAFVRGYLAGGPAPRALGALGAAFLHALAGLLAARDVVSFLGFLGADDARPGRGDPRRAP